LLALTDDDRYETCYVSSIQHNWYYVIDRKYLSSPSQVFSVDYTRSENVNNFDMRATLIVAASLTKHIYTHVIMMREKWTGKRVCMIRRTYTNKMDSGHTRSISVSITSMSLPFFSKLEVTKQKTCILIIYLPSLSSMAFICSLSLSLALVYLLDRYQLCTSH
jgi:hypothetical protein